MNLRNWKILHKILLTIFALALAALAGGGYAGFKMKSIDDTYSRLIDTDSRALMLMVHDDDLTNDLGQKLWNAVAETDDATMKVLQSDFDKEAAAELAELDKGIQELPKYKEKLQKLRDMTQKDVDLSKPVFAATIANDNKAALKLGKEFKVANDAISEVVAKEIADQTKYVGDESDAASASTWSTIYTTLGAIFGAIFLVVFGAFMIVRNGITGPIHEIVGSLKSLSDGVLNIAISGTDREDEVGDIAKTAQIFKENLIEAERMRAQQKAEQDKQIERARKMEAAVTNFDKMIGEVIEFGILGLHGTASHGPDTVRDRRRDEPAVQQRVRRVGADDAECQYRSFCYRGTGLIDSGDRNPGQYVHAHHRRGRGASEGNQCQGEDTGRCRPEDWDRGDDY